MRVSEVIPLLLWMVLFHKESVKGATETSPAKTTNPTKWQQDCIIEHNNYRAEHNTGALKWSDDLTQKAQLWADYLGTYQLVSRGDKGENLFLTSGTQFPNCANIVKVFYDEINKYNYKVAVLSKATERFSQLLWKNTASLGVAFSKREDGKYIVVFRYKPPGNYNTKSAFQQNVLPAVKSKGSKIGGFLLTITTTLMATIVISNLL